MFPYPIEFSPSSASSVARTRGKFSGDYLIGVRTVKTREIQEIDQNYFDEDE